MKFPELDNTILKALQAGTVIPAHPLALKEDLKLDERRQRLLTQYYIASGVGGLAVGVHTTQFEIRKSGIDLLEPVLKITVEEIEKSASNQPFIKVAGVVGQTSQASREAETAKRLGYDLALVSMGGLNEYSEDQLIEHSRTVASIIPVFGFYLQPAVGGRVLSYDFWRRFVEIPNVYAIKVAAFNRYQTLDVLRAVCDSDSRERIALYTGNDDNIVADLVTPFRFTVNGKVIEKKFVGGLLGHWAVWTKSAVELLHKIKMQKPNDEGIQKLLSEGVKITDMNAAIFDAANSFHGCIPGIHEVLRRQGLLEGRWCLNPKEQLSGGQMEEIDRVIQSYPEYTDDKFVKEFLEKWNVNA
ncbi:MAG TPA: dihydrodipicolinate synthase family protein [Chryseolinea sp.]|nr:dihydrodipicolinate synthase family protein [Chryseolinea sp.]